MAVDPFNSVGGYTVGIPPQPIISETGAITAPSATFDTVSVGGDVTVSGNVSAGLFVGSFQGQIEGELTVTGNDKDVLINKQGLAGTDSHLTFDYDARILTVDGRAIANAYTLGIGSNEFSTASVMFATTTSASAGQVLHSQLGSTICSVDYTIIATDRTIGCRQTSKLFASVLDGEVGYFEYGTIDVPVTSPGVADFKVENVSGYVALTVKPATSHSITYKIMATSYKE